MMIFSTKLITAKIIYKITFSIISLLNITNALNVSSPIHSRHQRYVSFPEGSSFSVVICMTIGQIGNPDVDYLSYAINWGIAYELPNETWITQHLYGLKSKQKNTQSMEKYAIQRRHRRNLYGEMETIIDSMGYSGKDCILRALCEARKYLQKRKGSMEIELLKSLFSFPLAKVPRYEHEDIHRYDHAYRKAHKMEDCSKAYANCRFSLLDLVFGRYVNQQYGFM